MSNTQAKKPEVAPLAPMLVAEVRSVLIAYRRMPGFVAISVGLPLMFFFFFGLPNIHKTSGGVNIGAYILASLGAYAISNVMVYNVGIGIANDRARKLDLLQRAMPLPASIALLARMVGGLVLGIMSLSLLFAVAAVSGVTMSLGTWASMFGLLVVGCLPMLGLGLVLGYGAKITSAPALASPIYLPMAFGSGIFIPLSQLPTIVKKVAPFLPLYHYGQLGWNLIGAGDESLWQAIAWTAAWAIVLFAVAGQAYRMDAARKFA